MARPFEIDTHGCHKGYLEETQGYDDLMILLLCNKTVSSLLNEIAIQDSRTSQHEVGRNSLPRSR